MASSPGRPHKAKPTTHKTSKRRCARGGRNERRHQRYRARVGRPRGPGVSGNKRGKNSGS